MAELERDSVKEAEDDVLLHPNLLQHYESELVFDDEEDVISGIKLDIRKHLKLILQLEKIDVKDSKGVDEATIQQVYENRTTKGSVFTAKHKDNKFDFVFYFAFKQEESKVIKVLPDVAPHVIGKLIAEDLSKPKPSPWELKSG